MNLSEIKTAVDNGQTVHWSNTGYVVISDRPGHYLIHCLSNDNYCGLTWLDGVTLNGEESQFFIGAPHAN